MKSKNVQFQLGETLSIRKEGEKLIATIRQPNEFNIQEDVEHEFDNIFMAIGRTPDVSELNLDQLGVKFDKSKKIVTNQQFQTDVENIYAIGDIKSGGLELTPVAIKEAEYLVEGIVNN